MLYTYGLQNIKTVSIVRTTMRRFSSVFTFNKTSKLQTILFDIDIVVGDNQDVLQKLTRTTGMENSNVRGSADASDTQSDKGHARVYDTSREIDQVSTIKTKYMDKVYRKLGGSYMEKVVCSNIETDAQMLHRAKEIPVSKPSRWLLQPGMGEVLDYVHSRTILLGIVRHALTPNEVMDTLKVQLASTSIYPAYEMLLVPLNGSQTAQQQHFYDQQINAIEKQLMVESLPFAKHVMLVSASDEVLGIAKTRGYLTCRFRPEGGRYGSMSTDFVAKDVMGIQDVVEDLNGVAMRPSAFSNRFTEIR